VTAGCRRSARRPTPPPAARRRGGADAAGRAIDAEHWGALVLYAGGQVPDRLAELVARRRPGVPLADLVATGPVGVRTVLERFVEVGFSKFVVVPVGDTADWTAELEALADAVLPLQA
jgi:hypothetical protein